MNEYNKYYKELIRKHGIVAQEGYFYEEIGELLQALNKYKRANGRITTFNILTEIVDVQITLDILKECYGMTPELFEDVMFIKMDKIKKYLQEEK